MRSKNPRQNRERPNLDSPREPLTVVDVDLSGLVARERRELRDVAMHLAVHVEALGDVAAHQLEAAVEVASLDPAHLRGRPVVELRRGALHEPVMSDRPSPGDEVVALVEAGQQLVELGRVVLAVGVHQGDEVGVDGVERGPQRLGLAEVPPLADRPQGGDTPPGAGRGPRRSCRCCRRRRRGSPTRRTVDRGRSASSGITRGRLSASL